MEKSIALFEKALTIFTQESGPLNWAYTQSKIGAAYAHRIQGDRTENLEKAIAALKAALTVRTRENQPFFHFMTAVLLGPTLLKLQRWTEASSVYATAREAFLVMFGQGLNEAEARDLIAHAGPLFAEAAFAATQLGEGEKALALATEGRARLMAVALKLQTLGLSADKRRRLDELRAEIRGADSAMETERAAAVERLAGLRQELLGLVKDADASAGLRRGSALTQARALAGKDGVVVVPVVTRLGGKILIVSGSDPVGLPPRHDGKGVAANGPTGDGGTKGQTRRV
jgi:hypothetical protein